MKKVLKVFGILVVALLLVVAGLLTYVKTALPNVGAAPEIKVEATPAMVERGKYLAHHVAVCMDCHSTRDWSKFSGPPMAGTFGKGGERFDRETGVPGVFYSRNITPSGIGDWTDGELMRAIAAGVNREGKPLFPLMPHPTYGRMDETDIRSIIAYLRTLKPITNEIPESEVDFPMSFILHTIPQPSQFQQRPDTTNLVAYGKYLVSMASCADCHTKAEKGEPVAGMEFAGGVEFQLPGGVVRSANLTPDKETGLGNWSKTAFIQRFKALDPALGYQAHTVKPTDMQTIMPWTMYAGMTEYDLGAMYEYLQSLKPVKNPVQKFPAVLVKNQ